MPEPAHRDGRLAADGMCACYIWYKVLAAQADRLAETGFVPEGYVFVIALRNLRRAAALVHSALAPGQAETTAAAALAEFDRALPGATQARDILEHFDDYARGTGYLHRRQATPARFPVTVDTRPAPGGGQQMVLGVGEFTVPIVDATAAACLLMADMHAAAHPDPAYTPAWSRVALCDGAAHGVLVG